MLGKKNQGNGYWNLPARGDWYQNFLVMAQSEIEKFFRRRVIPISHSKIHTGTGITRAKPDNGTEI